MGFIVGPIQFGLSILVTAAVAPAAIFVYRKVNEFLNPAIKSKLDEELSKLDDLLDEGDKK